MRKMWWRRLPSQSKVSSRTNHILVYNNNPGPTLYEEITSFQSHALSEARIAAHLSETCVLHPDIFRLGVHVRCQLDGDVFDLKCS
jgi:hypothetical protein